jgi:RNA polymerase sigma-70 factor (ECF subfamily)
VTAADAGEAFLAERGRLFGIAYRILGSVADAEDVLQDTWLAVQGAETGQVRDPAAYLTTAVARRSLNRLRDNARRREDYIGPWLPEPVSTLPGPEESAALADSVSMAMLVLLDSMSPYERVAFVLCDVFQVPAPEVATVLGRSPAAVRQLASRGRRRAREHGPPPRDDAAHNRVADAFAVAVARGDVAGVVAVLAPDVQFVSDGGGLVPAALRPVLGADKVARLVLGLVARDPGLTAEPVVVNGRRGYLVTQQGGARSVLQLEVADGQVRRLWVTSNPDKLTGI